MTRTLIGAGLIALLPGCSLFGDEGPLRIAAIGALHRNPDRISEPPSLPDQLLLDAVGQGLVRAGADGQIAPGLAERWTVIDDGRSYIFRLRDARWPNGQPVRAGDIAAMLRQRIASSRLRMPMRGEFQSMSQVRAMTSRVIEVQLRQPRPDLLDLLSQPDMTFTRNGLGWGPLAPTWSGATVTLTPRRSPDEPAADSQTIMLWGSNSAIATAQFSRSAADAVIGGRFEGWPMVAAADISDQSVVVDPVEGLFGLAVVSDDGLVADMRARNAIAMAFDRTRMLNSVGVPGWRPRVTFRTEPGSGRDSPSPVYPAWAELSVADRQREARALVANWRERNGASERPVVRIAMPAGPGARMLFAWMRNDLARIGVSAQLVPLSADADLRLLDEVAPSRDPAWFVRRLDCGRQVSCSAQASELIAAIDAAEPGTDRANAIVAAEDALTLHMGFIPIAAPVRWSLRSNRTPGLVANVRGLHGLYHLRSSPN